MSQAGFISPSGPAPGDVNSLTPDSGGVVTPVGGTIDVFGYKAGTVQTMETYKTSNGVLQIADQTWQTQYVVDASTTNGLKGTFTTIQSALDQAEVDGASVSNWKKIFVRSGTYTENLLIPSGVIIEGNSFGDSGLGGLVSTQLGTIIQGTHDVKANGSCVFRYVSFLNNGNNFLFDISAGGFGSKMLFESCTLTSTSTSVGIFRNINDSGTFRLVLFNCTVSTASVYPVYDFVFSNSSTGTLVSFLDCIFGDTPPSGLNTSKPSDIQASGNMVLYIDNCIGINSIDLSGTSLECYDTTFVNYITGRSEYFISGTGTGYLSDCDFGSNSSLSYFPTSGAAIQSTTGPWGISGLTAYGGIIYEDATSVNEGQSTQGDVLQVTTSAISYVASVNDYYIGITDTSSARTVTLPDITTVTNGKVFIIKDESLASGTNAITISVSGGATIDGLASQSINTNGGSMSIIKRGSNYFII